MSEDAGVGRRVEVVLCHAPEDQKLVNGLLKHLAGLQNQGLISTWHAAVVVAGEDWQASTIEAFRRAEVILLLISASFLASDRHYEDMEDAVIRHDAGEARVIPVLLRPCDWQIAPFSGLQALPRNGKPVFSWRSKDEAFTEVATEIREAITVVRASQTGAPTPIYPDEETKALSRILIAARSRKRRLEEVGVSTAEVDREILDLRRQIREGGQLRGGDSLGDGRYLLLEKVGRGGFGSVWRARERQSSEDVAIKVLHTELSTDNVRRERFFRGARRMAALSQEGVVRIIQPNGEDGGYQYFVMEYIEGGDLHRAVLEGRLPRQEVVAFMLRVGDALAKVHAEGLVHRDIKPSNILLSGAGSPKLTDFDLVAAMDTTGGTRTGALGTLLYASPELMDRPQEADASADVYGLGMTMIFGLRGADLTMLDVFDRGKLFDGLPCSEAIKQVLRRSVETERGLRYRDAAAWCTALREALVYQPAAPPPVLQASERVTPPGAYQATPPTVYHVASFGRDVRRRREALGMSLEELAERARLTGNYILTIENGKRDPSLSSVLAIAMALQLSAGEFFDFADLTPGGLEVAHLFDATSGEVQMGLLGILRGLSGSPSRAGEIAALYASAPLDVRKAVASLLKATSAEAFGGAPSAAPPRKKRPKGSI